MLSLSLLGLAVVDALNPFSIAAMALLLATDRPMARGWVFVAGTFVVYLPFGIVLVEGWTAALSALLPLLPVWLKGGAVLVAGLACISLAIYLLRQVQSLDAGASLSRAMTLPATAAFAVASTLSDAPTAVPFFAASAIIPDLASGRVGQYLWVALYCLVYIAPLLLMLGIRAAMGAHGEVVLERVQRGVGWSFRYILPPILVLGGGWLCWLGLTFLL
ncbi:GAP family protein [Paracoccus sanguinis]|uniref:Sap, sulfolipid-1-addressing protein n=1 Tax=Paracoccus sanguinis TaxID=1545044 RepID=A0A099GM52_9RHOB|nr:GAP family protein [Paracoccus sanguinis]KGJ23582.1 hypothetical protein IX56_01255 [Paracoccus sanguinis]